MSKSFKSKYFSFFFLFLTWLSPLVASSGEEKEGDHKNFQDKHRIYHSRESQSYIGGIAWKHDETIPITAYGPKHRAGGLGPEGSIEISPWVRSVKWIRNMKEGESLEFIFDPNLHSVYVAVNDTKVAGHDHLSHITSSGNPYGGNIKKKGSLYRTNELSGHFGAKWHDKIRFKFIELMFQKGLKVLHEPWARDSVVSQNLPLLYHKKISDEKVKFDNNDYIELAKIEERSIFSQFTDEMLSIYQNNFLRKFGNSIFNMFFHVGVHITPWSAPPSKFLYVQDPESPYSFSLKEEFRNKGSLDMSFYTPEYGFVNPEKLEGILFDYFKGQL